MRQRGVTLIGLLFWAIIIVFVGLVAVKAVPTVIEYFTISRAVNKIAVEASNMTVGEIRRAFDRQKDVETGIESLSGTDLEITKDDTGVVITFAYDKEVPVAGPVFLLIKYRGQSR